jgi:hypothetical protein
MAAYECGTTDFPEPYPESIVCPEQSPETKAVITYVKNKAINAFSPLGCSLNDCFQVFIASFINH